MRWRRCAGSRACQYGSSTGTSRRARKAGKVGPRAEASERPSGELLAYPSPVVTVLDLQVGLEQVEDRQIGGGLAIGGRATFQQEPALGTRRIGELVKEAGLPDSRLPNDCHHLAM